MSLYLEIPDLDTELPFRTFLNDGMIIVYPHWHKEIEMIYSHRGSVNIGVGDKIIQLKEGEVFFFASGEPHYFLASPESERFVYQFDLKIFDELHLRKEEKSLLALFEEGEPHSSNWPQELSSKIKQLLVELYELEIHDSVGKNYLILSNLYRMVGEFYQHLPLREKHQDVPVERSQIQYKETLKRLNKVFEYVETHYQETITLGKAAEYVGFSPYYFTRFFKTNTGKTFMNFLTEYRVNQAKFILANEKIPMIDVAEKAGFTSVKTFHHVFKEVVGQSPLKYQKEIARSVELANHE